MNERPSVVGHGIKEVFRSIASPIDTARALFNKSRWQRAADSLQSKGLNNLNLTEGSEDLKNLRSLASMTRNSRAMDNLRFRAKRGDGGASLLVKGRRALRAAASDPNTANTLLQLRRSPIASTLFGSVSTNARQLNALRGVLEPNSPYASILSGRQMNSIRSGYGKLNTMYNIKRSLFGAPTNQ